MWSKLRLNFTSAGKQVVEMEALFPLRLNELLGAAQPSFVMEIKYRVSVIDDCVFAPKQVASNQPIYGSSSTRL
jgi:hypothetical protein